MRRALELARLGRVGTHPNPMVGAVLVRDGVVVGEGYHERFGGPHAEVIALREAAGAARGATLYVTLEPCAHHGKTPPCVDAVIAAGVATVVIAALDPSPTAGGGAARLREAGIAVIDGVERDAAKSLNAAFYHVHEHGAPFVALKLAQSLDGRIAAAPGVRTRLTGAAAQAATHRLRAAHDAVLIGSTTALVDDPLLTVRGVHTGTRPTRVVLDTAARLSPDSRLVASIPDAPLIVVCAADAPDDRVRRLLDAGVQVLRAPRDGGDRDAGVDAASALRLLADAGMRAILVEGGSAIAASLLAARLVHRLYLFIAPIFLGAGGVLAFATAPATVADVSAHAAAGGAWRYTSVELYGADLLLTLDPAVEPVEIF
jgi:diaminohydroxyphosphoribosylaminopyrimidine deaminase / 5-amino-6-(5-phosphoribosylamino)uracil reductase